MNLETSLVLQTKIKEEITGIIDLDLEKTPEDLVYEWDSKVKMKLKRNITADSEQNLDMLMKWYMQTIKEEAINFEDIKSLRLVTANHIKFFKLYFDELNCCFVDNYLDNLEELLTFYINLEVKFQTLKQRDGIRRSFRRLASYLISTLNVYLQNREERICHVLMKVKLNFESEDSRSLLNCLYRTFLTMQPRDISDLEFCRAYILYQKWKTIRKPEEWDEMDEIMYTLYHRTPDCIKSNPVLRQILLPQNNSILDTLIHISEKHLIITDEYFRYLKFNKIEEDDIIVAPSSDSDMPDDLDFQSGDEEDRKLHEAYRSFVKNMSSLHLEGGQGSTASSTVKEESPSDDDCQIVSVDLCENRLDGIVHEILDDDDDIEIIYIKNKDDRENTPREVKKSCAPLSFLDSIDVPEHNKFVDHATSSRNDASLYGTGDFVASTSSSGAAQIQTDQPAPSNSSVETPVTDPVLPDVEMRSVTRAEPSSEPYGSNAENDAPCESGTMDVAVEPNLAPAGEEKKVVSAETQTDDWRAEENPAKLPPLERRAEENEILPRVDHVSSLDSYCSRTTSRPSTSVRNGPEISVGIPCTSPDYLITSQASPTRSNSVAFNNPTKPTEISGISSTSADVTSTSTDVQDFDVSPGGRDTQNEEERLEYHHADLEGCQIESNYANDESYCTEGYVEYAECNESPESVGYENVTQSNLEDEEVYIEDHILVNNPEELAYIVDDALPIGASVNICTEEPSTSRHVPSASVSSVQDRAAGESEEEDREKRLRAILPLKELKVSVAKMGLDSLRKRTSEDGDSPSKKIMFTTGDKVAQPATNDFSKFEEMHLQWNNLRDTQDIDAIFSGPVSMLNGIGSCVSPDEGFNVFNSEPAVAHGTPSVHRPTQSASDVISPPYEKMDSEDFRMYFEQRKVGDAPAARSHENVPSTSAAEPERSWPRPSTSGDKVTGLLVPKALETLQDVGQCSSANSADGESRSKREKRVHIADTFMESQNSVPQTQAPNMDGNLKGILKKPPSERMLRKREKLHLSRVKVNLKSLEYYNVSPNDPCLNSDPRIVFYRLADPEIKKWLRVSEISRRVRLEKERNHYVPPLPIRVDYIERNETQHGDAYVGGVSSSTESFREWGLNSEEGFRELAYTERKTGKRKRPSSSTQDFNTRAKVRRISDSKAESTVRKTTRKRKRS